MSKIKFQVLAALSATISEVSDGMQYAWSAPIVPVLLSKDSPVKFDKSQAVWIEVCLILGSLLGIPLTVWLVRHLGRKRSILLANCENLFAWLVIGTTRSVWAIYLARLVAGLSASIAFAAVPLYGAEIADKNVRGFISGFFSIMMLSGNLLVYCVAPFLSIAGSSAVGMLFLIVQLVTFPFMPESPYHYIVQNKVTAARRSLEFLRGTTDIDEELEEMIAGVARQESERTSVADIVRVESNRKALLILLVLNSGQHLAGGSVIIMNIHSILEGATGKVAPSTVAILFLFTMCVTGFIGSRLVDVWGRKPLLLISGVLTGATLLLLALYFTFRPQNNGWVPITLILLYAASFRFGLGLIPILLSAELFPTNIKELGITLSESGFTASSCLTILLYPYVNNAWGLSAPFYIFSICTFLVCVFVAYVVPETKRRSLEEIQLLLQ
ncbi:facilitated trehalose transporter Tret1-like [Photinus pyralis]|uniref:facilitated trehalose transporter Tret1-like n=1 Tax=Photinus pyralis TaxID=7054 RepID=UPI00126763E2|nr:facilitated trehalose transporter Tret1-like [Photinus pyralis]